MILSTSEARVWWGKYLNMAQYRAWEKIFEMCGGELEKS